MEGMDLDLGLGTSQQEETQSSEETDTSFGNQFLTQVDEADRPIVEKYISEWDKGVTQKFQTLNAELKPYKDLGVDYDSVQAAIGIMQMAEQDPVGFYHSIREQLEAMGLMDPTGDGSNNTGGQQEVTTALPEFEGLPPAAVKMIQGLSKQVEELAAFKNNTEAEREKQTNEQKLDKLLKTLETKHGKFDEHAVLGRMMNGMSPEDAIADYKKFHSSINSPSQKNSPPPVLGGGRTAVDQVDSSKMKDTKTRKAHVADMLAGLQD